MRKTSSLFVATLVLSAAAGSRSGAAGPPAADPQAGPAVIAETASIARYKKVRAKGSVRVTASGGDCLTSAFETAYQTLPGPPLPGGHEPAVVLGFVPGVEHSFSGNICWPTPGMAVTFNDAEYGWKQTFGDGGAEIQGPVKAKGKLTIEKAAIAAAIRIQSRGPGPLRLVVTTAGYKYVSGTGTLRTPGGKTYSWPAGAGKSTPAGGPNGR